jgi:hypothetical protein
MSKLKNIYKDLINKTNPYQDPKGYLNSPEAKKRQDKSKIVKQLLKNQKTIEEKEKKDLELQDSLELDTKAYPNDNQYIHIPPAHDVKKWEHTVKNIFYKQKAGLDYQQAIQQSTNGWKKMEVLSFLNWLRYYQERTPMKYKSAQVWYENGQPGYFLHIKKDQEKEEQEKEDAQSAADQQAESEAQEASQREEKRQIIEKQRSKIIARLDSAERLLRSLEGQHFAGPELESLMESIYNLKKKVQLVNKLSVSTRLYEDMIVREANVLSRKGFIKASNMLYAVAQTPGAAAEKSSGSQGEGKLPAPETPQDPSGAGMTGNMGDLTTQPGTPNINTPAGGDQNGDQPPVGALADPPAVIKKKEPKGIKDFTKNMNEGIQSDADLDNLEVNDQDEELVVEAQTIPAAALEDVPITDSPVPARGNKVEAPELAPKVKTKAPASLPDDNLEVTEDDIPKNSGKGQEGLNQFDQQVSQVFSNVTIEDVVAKLENISKTYKNKSGPRELSLIDLMLNSLGLSSLFIELYESINKSFESNNYINSRIDTMLAKLKGAVNSSDSTPTDPTQEVSQSPETLAIKNKLKSNEDKETQRKQKRKEQENIMTDEVAKETPEVEVQDDLATPLSPPVPSKVAPTV